MFSNLLLSCQKDRGGGILALPGGWGEFIQGLQSEDYGRGEDIQGVAVVAGTMPGMREGSGKGVTGDAPPNPLRRG